MQARVNSSFSLGQRAFEHVQFLVEKIGPRPAGSSAERQAQDYVSNRLRDWGYEVHKQPVAFAPLPRFFAGYMAAGLSIGILSWWVNIYPFLTIWLPLFLLLASTHARWSITRRSRREHSANIYAYTSAREDLPTIILCAHLDTARASAFRNKIYRLMNYYTFFVLQRVAVAIFLLSLLTIMGFILPRWIYSIVGALASLGAGWLVFSQTWNQLFHHNQYSPGANDNASGVGVVLALAEYYSINVPQSEFRLCFLFTTAEETSLSGALEFATLIKENRFRDSWMREKPTNFIMLNIDMVGAGNFLTRIEGEGVIFPSRTDKQMNDTLDQLSPGMKRVWYNTRSGDFACFAQQGIPSGALQITGSLKAELAYHTIDDNLEIIEIPALALASEFVKMFIDKYSLMVKPH